VGRVGAIAAIGGFLLFMSGVLSAGSTIAGPFAVTGMLLVLAGGMLRVYSE
jgi:hypothetical protein